MAWTVSKKPGVMGNQRTVLLEITTDSAEATIETGLGYIDNFAVGIQSCNTGPQWIASNSGSTGTAIGGALGCSGFTSGDHLYITVFGR
jgi:hypothetical protein